jgi:hypothetical protein
MAEIIALTICLAPYLLFEHSAATDSGPGIFRTVFNRRESTAVVSSGD